MVAGPVVGEEEQGARRRDALEEEVLVEVAVLVRRDARADLADDGRIPVRLGQLGPPRDAPVGPEGVLDEDDGSLSS